MLAVISIRVHRILDVMVSLFLIGLAWVNNFATEEPIIPGTLMVSGILMLTYGLFTRYQKNGKGALSIKTHLLLDFLLGLLLAASPWLFGFSHIVRAPHIAAGIMLASIALFSRSDYKKGGHHRSSGDHHRRPA